MKPVAMCLTLPLLALLVGCPPTEQQQTQSTGSAKTIHVAAILSLSGRYSSIDVPTEQALRLWVEQHNRTSGPLVKLDAQDAGSDPMRAVERFESIWLRGKKPEILILSTSSIAMAVTPHLKNREVVVVANAGHPDLIESSNDYTFSTFPDLQDECGLMTKQLSSLRANTLFIVHASDVYHQADAALLKTQYQGRIVGEEQYQEGTTDFSPVVNEIMRARPDAVVLFGFGISYPAFQSELARRRFTGRLVIDTDYVYNDVSVYPPTLLAQTQFVGPEHLTAATPFQKAYLDTYKRKMPYFASFIVDGLSLAVEAADKSPNARAMTDYLVSIKNRKLQSGTVSIGSDHHFSYDLIMYQPTPTGHVALPRE